MVREERRSAMLWEWSVREKRRPDIGWWEADGDEDVVEAAMAFLRDLISVSKRRISPSKEVWMDCAQG